MFRRLSTRSTRVELALLGEVGISVASPLALARHAPFPLLVLLSCLKNAARARGRGRLACSGQPEGTAGLAVAKGRRKRQAAVSIGVGVGWKVGGVSAHLPSSSATLDMGGRARASCCQHALISGPKQARSSERKTSGRLPSRTSCEATSKPEVPPKATSPCVISHSINPKEKVSADAV